ncbi:hypothetical protein SAMD00019534_119750 [Acytostelium subglobosum LB1]|uniref:hypothetical protein n=1 Tax=Acytostelium subglobosum LB1 TaxID=1410327 RepID=UPI000644C894|nr:hypothetical protein SAMD00019534_119750 [Acytostelium subglobosum LB1]GAM28799.1 hypothetical protein SAMD00019534_119750 [Acytostelium subglobosum LB1]|eukprot:XP_012748171.1 hypothetical protein SAMD00019534_119750 [Acytostelium subglobosum LB1]
MATLEIGSFNSARGRGMSLPDSLTSVKIRYCDEMDSQSMPALTPSVTSLIGVHFVSPSKLHSGCITSSVTELSFGQHFRGPLVPGFIPLSVTAISFGPHFRQKLNGDLIPTSVTSLSVCFDRLSDLSDLQMLDRLEMSQGTLIRLGKELGKAPLKRPLSKELLVNVVNGEGFTLSMLDIAPTISYSGRINFSFRKIRDGLVCLVVFQRYWITAISPRTNSSPSLCGDILLDIISGIIKELLGVRLRPLAFNDINVHLAQEYQRCCQVVV